MIVGCVGEILADMSHKAIMKTFHIPKFREMEVPTIMDAQGVWDENPLKCKKLINQYWLKEKRGSATKVPQELFCSDFYEEYHDLVTMLSRVMGLPTIAYFQEWMVYIVEEILNGNTKFYWPKIISDCFHEQFMAIKKTSRFYMNCYQVYSLAKRRKYHGLFRELDVESTRPLKVYDRYP